MAGGLNYTLDKTIGFDLDAIPEATADDMDDEVTDHDLDDASDESVTEFIKDGDISNKSE